MFDKPKFRVVYCLLFQCVALEEAVKLHEKERQQLEKRYSLPDQPHIIVHPSKTAKSGKFDCTVMSLSVLLDYRPEDTKEHSFEVSLFAELFNEMLMRDFGFNIYRALYELPESKPLTKGKEKEKEKEREEKPPRTKKNDKVGGKKDEVKREISGDKRVANTGGASDVKKEKKSDHESEDEEFDDDDEKDGKSVSGGGGSGCGAVSAVSKKERTSTDRRKRDRPRMFTKDRHLLLSFVYFDQTHCGYIFEKDIEELLYTLGLNLSRAQVRKLVGKVITRDSLHYRKLTDKPKEDDFIVIDDSEKDCNLEDLAVGNKRLLPVFNEGGAAKRRRTDGGPSENKEQGKSINSALGCYLVIRLPF